ncbi:MAG: hypothetical protein WBM24_19615 [Candidatus Sulfotelmatobacter sp.]
MTAENARSKQQGTVLPSRQVLDRIPHNRDWQGVPMMTKACTNSKCPAYAHFVYTVAMRCVLCRCDLKSAQRISETVADVRDRAHPGDTALSRKSAASHAGR